VTGRMEDATVLVDVQAALLAALDSGARSLQPQGKPRETVNLLRCPPSDQTRRTFPSCDVRASTKATDTDPWLPRSTIASA